MSDVERTILSLIYLLGIEDHILDALKKRLRKKGYDMPRLATIFPDE